MCTFHYANEKHNRIRSKLIIMLIETLHNIRTTSSLKKNNHLKGTRKAILISYN